MKIALLCVLLLSVVCFAQFDSTASTGATLNLQRVATSGNARHSERSATVTDQVEANNCRDRIHPVTNVQTSNGPLNSGTYFTVTITVNATAAQSLSVQFGEPTNTNVNNDYFDITGVSDSFGSETGSVGTCSSGQTCTFEYQCDQYPSNNRLEVRVSSASLSDPNVVSVGYTLSVTQYIEQVTSVGTSFTQGSAVSVTTNTTTTLGGRNFVQYYHEFGQTNGVDLGKYSTYYVVVSNFQQAPLDVNDVLCISFDSIISTTIDASSVQQNAATTPSPDGFNNGAAPGTIGTISDDEDDDTSCSYFCQRPATGSELIYIPIYPCGRSCNLDAIWIGVQTTTPKTFTLSISPAATTAPSPVQITNVPFSAEGLVNDLSTGNCLSTIDDIDYACEDYYVVNSATNIPSVSDSRLGPYLITHVYGPIGGNIDVDFTTNGLGGNSACCAGTPGECSLTPSGTFSCYNIIAPCDFDRSVDYVTTVTQTGTTDDDYPYVEYGIDITVDSYSVQTVSSTSTNFGTVEIGRQNHYKVTVNENEIFDDSYFEVELYFPNEDGQNIAFAWNLNAPAGAPEDTCYSALGRCDGDLECDSFNAPQGDGDVYTLSGSAVPRCRFTFIDCFEPEREDPQISYRLQAGTYWFNVYDQRGGVVALSEYTEGIDYTLKFHLRRASTLYANRVTLGKVYDLERTAQYKFTMPETPTDFRVLLDGVRNGQATMYVECGRPAGRCPCGTSFASCVASGEGASLCEIYVPSCACDADELYITVYGVESAASSDSVPTRFTLTIEVVGDNEQVPLLPVSRAGTTVNAEQPSRILNTEYYGRELLSESLAPLSDIVLYELDMTNVNLQTTDQLAVTFAFLSSRNSFDTVDDRTDVVREGLGVISKSPFGLPQGDESFGDENFDISGRAGCEFLSCVAHPTGLDDDDEQNGSSDEDLVYAACTIVINNCNQECGNSISLSDKLYVRAQGGINFAANTHVSITAEIRPEFVVPLTVSTPVHGATARLAYQHYSFSLSGAAVNSRLLFKAYSPANSWPLEVFVNYYSGVGQRVLAGSPSDCLNNILCEPCQLNFNGNDNVCIYEVSPCVLSTESGTYYLSVSEIEVDDTVHVGERYGGHPYDIPFTLEAYYEPIVNLLAAERILENSIYREETAYYFVNIPTGVRDTLRIEFEANSENALVGLSFTQPDDQCVACVDEREVAAGDVLRLNYFPCDIPAESTLYISVRGMDLGECDKLDYVLHAHVDQISQTSLSLVSATAPLTAINNSTGRVTLSNGEFQVYSFSASAADGEYLLIDLTQSNPDESIPQSFSVYLSVDAPAFPASSTSEVFGTPRSTCGTQIATCTAATYLDNSPCRITLEPCAYESATYYLTFDGTSVGAGEQTNAIDILIREFGVESFVVPALGNTRRNNYTANAAFDDFSRGALTFPRRSLRATGVSIQGGTNIEFQAGPNVNNLYIRLGDETQPDCSATCIGTTCTLYACETVNSRDLFIYVVQSSSQDFYIDVTVSNSDSTFSTSVTTLPLNQRQNFTAQSNVADRDQDEFRYISFTIPQTDVGYYSVDTTGISFGNGEVFSYTGNRRFLPGFTATGTDFTIDNSLTVGRTCGFTEVTATPSDECCFDAQTFNWVVVGVDEAFSFTVNYVDDNTQSRNIGFPANVVDGFNGDENAYDLYTFTVPNGNDALLTFNVTAGAAQIYINYGSTAGSDSDDPENDLSSCYRNINSQIFDGQCSGNRTAASQQCAIYLPACDRVCIGDSSVQYSLAVVNRNSVNTINTAYRVTLNSASNVQTISSGRNSAGIPNVATSQIISGTTSTNIGSGSGNRLGGTFIYNVPNSVVNALTGSQIPPFVALNGQEDDFYPRVTFNFTNFRDASGATVSASNFDVQVGASDCDSSEISNTFCDLRYQTADTFEFCARSLCNFGCSGSAGNSVSFFIANNNGNSVDRFTFDVIITEVVNELTNANLDSNFVYDTLSIGNNGDSSTGNAVQADSVFIRADFSNLADNQYQVLTISIDNSNIGGSYSVNVYSDVCGSAISNSLGDCNSIGNGESCTVVYDPCATDFLSLDNTVYIFEIAAPSTANFTYSFSYEVRTVSFIDTSAARLTPGGVMSYSADKEIAEMTWQFYQIEVTENDGYSYLDLSVGSFSCIQTGDSLEVYTSFVYADDTDLLREIVTPSRYPTESCFVNNPSGALSESFDTCKTVGGFYQIGVYAPNDIDLVNEANFDGTVPVRNVQYSISATLNTLEYILAVPGCSLTQTVGSASYVPRIELRLEALPANSRVVMGVTSESGAVDFAYGLTAPEGLNNECQLPNRVVDEQFVTVNACDVESETYYIYIYGATTGTVVTFFSEIEYNYAVQLPTTDTFVHSTNLALRSTLYQDEDLVALIGADNEFFRYTQYYRYEISAATEMTISTGACADCSFDASVIEPTYCPDFACGSPDLVCDGTTSCTFQISSCADSYPNSRFVYIAITRLGDFDNNGAMDANCTVTIQGNALFASLTGATTLANEQIICQPVECRELYQITGDASQRLGSNELVTIVTDVDLTVYRLVSGSSCPESQPCTAGSDSCVVDISSDCTLTDYIYVVVNDCNTCVAGDSLYSISYTRDVTNSTTLSVGGTLSSASGSVVVTVPANTIATYSASSSVFYVERGSASCGSVCNPVLTPSDPSTSTQFVFADAPAGFQVSSLPITTLSGSRSISFQDAGFEYLRYNVPAGVRQVTFSFDNIATIGDAPAIRYALGNSPVVPSTCGSACTSFAQLTADATCTNNYNVLTRDVCEGEVLYLSIGLCSDIACGVSFDITVSATSETAFPPAADRAHTAAWTRISNEVPSASCGSNSNAVSQVNFSVDVEDILFVALRDPRGQSASVEVSQCTGTVGSCFVAPITAGLNGNGDSSTAGNADYSCSVFEGGCAGFYCVDTPGSYDVTINAPTAPGSVEYQYVNQWVSLTSSASDSLRGREAHFYEIANADEALSVVLTVTSGPAVEFSLTEGCSVPAGRTRYQETKTCAYGACPIWIPTRAESPRAGSLYVVIDSQTLSTGRFDNVDLAKDTTYTITVTRGVANCATPPSSGFCADASSGSVNVFSTASNAQVWRFSNTTAKNLEAQCYYNSLVDGSCSISTQVCRNYLKTLACLTVFPQCDASGFQMPVCNDICSGLAAACGDDQGLLNNLGCGSDRFALASNGTCVTNALADSVIPEEDTRVAAVSVHDAALPQQLVAPQFAPIYATMPALILDDDDGAKLLENFNEVKASESSSASTLIVSFFMLLVLLF